MKKWILLWRDNKKQLSIIVVFDLLLILMLVAIFRLVIYDIMTDGLTSFNFTGSGLCGIATLLVMEFIRDTINNINKDLKKYEKPFIVLENLED